MEIPTNEGARQGDPAHLLCTRVHTAPVRSNFRSMTSLSLLKAVLQNDVALARTLIEHGAAFYVTETPPMAVRISLLRTAVDVGNLEMVRLFVEGGALLGDQGTVWENIRHCCFPDISQYLFDMGAGYRSHVYHGNTEVVYWLADLRLDLMDVLLAQGATLEAIGACLTPFLQCVGTRPELVGPLLERGADIEEVSSSSHTAALLHAMERSPASDTVRALAHRGADMNAKNKWGYTALYVAKEHKLDKDLLMWREEYLKGRNTSIMAGHMLLIPPLADMIGEYVSR